jgi:hypothetical protein
MRWSTWHARHPVTETYPLACNPLIIFNRNLMKTLWAMSSISQLICCAVAIALLSCTTARAQQSFSLLQPPQTQIARPDLSLAYSPRLQSTPGDENENLQLPSRLQRQIVKFPSHEVPGTVIVDTANTFLYYILGSGKAIRYGIGVGREGFTWSGVKSVARKAEWPDWYPPTQMIGANPIFRAWLRAVLAIHLARVRFISAAPNIAFTAPMTRPALASAPRVAAFVWSTMM